MHHIQSGLVHYGLSKNEASIYIYLLKVLQANAFTIAKHTSIPRTTCYKTLDSLKTQGLVSSFTKNKVLFFSPANPNHLKEILTEKQTVLEPILPELHALVDHAPHNPELKLYVGISGIKEVLGEILDTCMKERIKTLYVASNPTLLDAIPKFLPNWIQQRAAQGIHTKMIIPSSMQHRKEYYTGYSREVKLLPDEFFFESAIDIYGDQAAFFSYKEGQYYSVILNSPTMVNVMKQLFLFTWHSIGQQPYH